MVRFISIRSEQEVFKAGVVSVVCIALFDLGAVMIGLCGRVMFPDLADAETILPQVSAALFPPIINGLVMVVVLAAIMSTVDSLLILASSAVVRDYLEKVRKYSQDDQRLARIGQWVTVIIGVFATLVALTSTPEKFACGIDIVGPSNLVTFLEALPAGTPATMNLWARRVGDVRTDEGRMLLAQRSPLPHVAQITPPFLLAPVAAHPRVQQAKSAGAVRARRPGAAPVRRGSAGRRCRFGVGGGASARGAGPRWWSGSSACCS